ncbi:MAG: beta-galactosidase [Victivallales bacterium]|nr:beta-galactosidase [Victivallales bacterium]
MNRLLVLYACLMGMHLFAETGWDFLHGGNGSTWKLPEKAEVRWTDEGLYLHGQVSDGMEMVFPDGLDAGALPFLNYVISTAEYASARLYFAHDGEEYSEERCIRFPLKGSEIVCTGRVDCRSHKAWRGTIRRIRLHPIVRDLDNATVRQLFFSDGSGGMLENGSFETVLPVKESPLAGWSVCGEAERHQEAVKGKWALRLRGEARACQEFERKHEYDVSLALSHRLERGGKLRLIHKDIFEKEISQEVHPLAAGKSWSRSQFTLKPPKGTAYVLLQLEGNGGDSDFDALEATEIRPSSENFRWWNHSSWIWDPANMNSEGKPIHFRKTFQVQNPQEVERVVLQVVTRNMTGEIPSDATAVFLNGTRLTRAYWSPRWTWAAIYELKPHLRQGRNLLAIEVVNTSNPGGLNADILVVHQGKDESRFQRGGTDERWKVSDQGDEGWQAPDFDDKGWRKARLRGQATPGSFCRLPYRFFGTGGEMALSNLSFPSHLSTAKPVEVSADMTLRPMTGHDGVLAGASLHFHLIEEACAVTVKFRRIWLTPEMMSKGPQRLSFQLNPRYLRKGRYTFRVYADRLTLVSAPAGFSLNKSGNFLEKEVEVIDEQRTELPSVKLTGNEEVPRFVVNGAEYPAVRFTHGVHTQFTTEESLDIVERVHSTATPIMDLIAGKWHLRADGTYDFTAMDTFFMSYFTRHPEAYVNLHHTLDTSGCRGPLREWILRHPECWAKDADGSVQSGTYLATNIVASMASEAWREKVAEAATRLVEHFRDSPYAERIIGVMPCCGLSHEWMYWGSQAKGFMDYSNPFQVGFREFAKRKYGSLAAANTAWRKNFASWEQVTIPSKKERLARELHDFLSPEKEQAIMDMREFLNRTVADSILRVCHAVKQSSDGRLLAGVYYGYSLYVAGPYGGPFSGHHALSQVLESPDVDYLFSPCRYDDRAPGGASGAMLPLASLRKHGKLYMDEADNRLLHSWDKSGRAETLRESRSVIEREFAYALTMGAGLAWQDFGEGWLPYDSRLCAVFENCLQMAARFTRENRLRQDESNAIAVVLDEKAIHHTAYDQRLFLNLVGIYPHLLRTGAGVHWYLLEDLERLEPYRCIVFTPTVTNFTEKQEEFLEKRLKKNGRTLVFLYSSGVYRDGRLDFGNAGRAAGFGVEVQRGMQRRALRRTQVSDPILRGVPDYYTFGFAEATEFFIYPKPSQGTSVLFTLDGGELPGMVRKEHGEWTSIYCSSPGLSARVLRGIAASAGIRIFNEFPGDVTYAARGIATVHTHSGGPRRFAVPVGTTEVTEEISGKRLSVKDACFETVLPKASTMIFTWK